MSSQPRFALITGCTSGIGKHLALEFAAKGVTVLATARKAEALAELAAAHDNIEPLSLEADSEESRLRLRDAVVARTGGRLDYLVNNAGTHYAATALDLELSEVIHLFTVNVFAVMHLCQLFVPLLRKSDSAKIVQIGSVTRVVPVLWQSAYNASKAALSQYTRTLRLELRPLNIKVIEIVTGFVRSNLLHHGLIAPKDSIYLPLKEYIENFKNHGNATGTTPEVYAQSVVAKLLAKSTSPEMWEGRQSWTLRWLTSLLPVSLLNWVLSRSFKIDTLQVPADKPE
ncbi:hypothetical protein B0I35DRAFT_481976 [Stachybotrys elegans]|uniref:Uncharacterized protein n=1 Tax=Stachybotrys elegans TaxID=80388 RepID=A0A8K0SIR9_9HYPO|nr:hypothetical protein B0I35DRAFT_481976 [Stachybotrys elegans]